MVIDNLKLDRDVRQDRAQIRCSTHFILRGYKVTFADLENLGQFDLLLDTPVGPFEVECKTITQDTSAQIKAELVASMSNSFTGQLQKSRPSLSRDYSRLTLKKPVASCKDLPRQLALALQGKTPGAYHGADFSLQFSPRPEWRELLNSDRWPDLFRQIKLEFRWANMRGIVRYRRQDSRARYPGSCAVRLAQALSSKSSKTQPTNAAVKGQVRSGYILQVFPKRISAHYSNFR